MTERILYGVCSVCILLCLACCLGTMLYYRRELRRFSRALQTYEQTGFLGDEDCKEEMESKLLSQLFRVLRRSSLEREKAGKEKGEIASLLSDLSHQLKTPLANILLNTEILKEEKLTKEEQKVFLKRNQEQAEKMQWLMKNLVKASRLEQGILTFESHPAPLGETIAKSINGVYAQAREKDIELEAGSFTECFPVHNPKWTAEAMGNILENAVKYSPAGSGTRDRGYRRGISIRSFSVFTGAARWNRKKAPVWGCIWPSLSCRKRKAILQFLPGKGREAVFPCFF